MVHFKKNIIFVLTIVLLAISGCSNDHSDSNNQQENPITNPALEENENKKEKEALEEVKELIVPDQELEKKSEGRDVELLQKALIHIGYPITVNGIYDEATTWAITDFQLQHDELPALGVFNKETKSVLEKYIENEESIQAGKALPPVDEPVFTSEGKHILGNPYDQLAIINKENTLPSDYEPDDLVVPDVRFPFTEDLPKKKMRKVAADALEKLFAAADKDGIKLYAQSGYRSYETQETLFANYVQRDGEEAANKYSARPGESEHQSGLTMDVTSEAVNYELTVEFGETKEGKWLQEHAADYGFIIRYPKGKEEITKYQYEPWHIRYVGKKAAKAIMENNITLEEYFSQEQ